MQRKPRQVPAAKRNADCRRRTPGAGTARPLLLALGLVLASPLAGADDEWEQCGGPLALPEIPSPLRGEAPEEPDTVHVESDDADLSREGFSSLSGNVHLQRGSRHLRAEQLVYEHETERVSAESGVQLWDEGLFLGAEKVHVDLAEERALAERARFMLQEAHARGGAERISIEGRNRLFVEDGHYSTCNPGDAAWVLEAGEIEIDREKAIGMARDVWIRVHRVPVFYTPFLSFPLSAERKSGFLPPSARVSSSSGLEVGAAYYFNLAPNRDATLSAHWLHERGTLASGEYRYLMPWGRGHLSGEYLPDDRKYDGERGAVDVQHLGSFASHWSAEFDYQWASDAHYFQDFGSDLEQSARAHLPQRADLIYTRPGFRIRGRVQDYQTLDEDLADEDLPYARLPQILATTRLPERNRQINFAGAMELVHFERDTGITGSRIDLHPSFYFPLRGPYGFLVPKAGLRITRYELSGSPSGADDTPSRLLPFFSADGGLVYERDMTFDSHALVQTLEPRAFYLFVPKRDQADLPLFDTGYASVDFAQLFRENRFNGADRVGDANQLTLALGSRLLSPIWGTEFARARVAQVYYFRDREVTLPGLDPEEDAVSDIIAEGTLSGLHPWSLRGALHWDPGDGRINKVGTALRYRPDSSRVVNAAYRFRRAHLLRDQEALEQVDLSLAWPLGRGWRVVARLNHALREGRNIDSFAGLEYNGCCLAVRTLVRRHLNSGDEGDYSNAVFLNFELKGLGGAGTAESGALLQRIPGYEDHF